MKFITYNKKCSELKDRIIEGPWTEEPDRVEFSHAGLDCLLIRNEEMLHWCGYVGVPRDHPLYGKEYDDVEDIQVHGGLTYSRDGLGNSKWWFGFDCAHAWDLTPGVAFHPDFGLGTPPIENVSYKDLFYARSQAENLAEQLQGKTNGKA